MTAPFVRGMRGLGDNIFQRAFVRTLAERHPVVWLQTPWPELYDDIAGVRFVQDSTTLRTQAKNIRRQPATRWSPPPSVRVFDIRPSYGASHLRGGSIVDAMRKAFGVEPAGWNLPQFPAYPGRGRPIAVVRPVTERREWHNPARGPRPEYVAQVAADLMSTHHVVSVADLVHAEEWIVGDAPPCHEQLHGGELDVAALLGLVQSADVVVGGVGWIVPACVCTRTPLFCILGGHGMHNAPAKITDSRMPLDHVRFAMPDEFCQCENMRHGCNKRIARLPDQWRAFRRECLREDAGA